ncbi:uncharacterized protein LOC117189809 [Drosophila miranda]|uniref:uncharacterized protein LOC117189809 n=1 Tax=Drosophila miranda TaxID=7229 RepID=UPI00143FAD62|nr:uncharacterized protein LOC117189809 [Drosophila miranda]
MSKKMWNKIFKSKSQKPQPLAKINKRHSRGIYEEYQQLNDLLVSEKAQLNFCNQRENENENGNGCGNGSINVFEQQPLKSSFNSLQLIEAQQSLPQQQHQQQQLSTFSRVRNTFSLKRNSNGSSSSSNKGKKNLPNAKSTTFNTEAELEAPECGQEEEPSSPPLTR